MNELSPALLLDTAICAAEAAGRHALTNKHRRSETSERFKHDVKLVMDLECQRIAEEVLASEFPDHGILGEEDAQPNRATDYEWIIDPIDGTMNYTHDFPYWCCSVAVRHRDRIVAGCVYAPEFDTYYTAHIEEPAKCNGELIRVSDTKTLDQALIFSGLSKQMETAGNAHFEMFRQLALNTQKVRITGAAALDLCHVAAGSCDGFMESTLYLWDYAAAGLIAQQAGAVLAVYPEREALHQASVICANEALIEGLRAIYSENLNS
jgi:myo-inositol-1(or 4)-monophosphatase